MALAEEARHDEDPETPLTSPRWVHWRERGYCRLWQAVMLSLGLEPSRNNREQLEASQEGLFAEFRRRKEVAIIRYGFHPNLQPLLHPREGQEPPNRYVDLVKFANFANEIAWPKSKEFLVNLQTSAQPNSEAGNEDAVEYTDQLESDDSELGDLEPNAMLVRYGALLAVFEETLGKQTRTAPARKSGLFKDGKINVSALARRMIEAIGNVAGLGTKEKLRGHSLEKVRKEIASAKKLFKSFRK